MPNMRYHFEALLSRINPSGDRIELVAHRANELRDWLRDHDFETATPHTRLAGSYGRSTAIESIPDVDVLLFLPAGQLERTPNAVLIEVHKTLKNYPSGNVETRPQRRSVRIEQSDNVCLDVVPCVAENGLERSLWVPDRPQEKWIASDPLGYARRLTALNQSHGGKVVPLVKMLKAWRDEQMAQRKPKSYVLEVIVLHAVEDGSLKLCDHSAAENVRDAFEYITNKYEELMDKGTESPRIPDPQISDSHITRGWERSHFETFMRRAREACRAARKAVDADDQSAANEEWHRVFGSRWPSEDDVRKAIHKEAAANQPGAARISSAGRIVGGVGSLPTLVTRYHGAT